MTKIPTRAAIGVGVALSIAGCASYRTPAPPPPAETIILPPSAISGTVVVRPAN